MPIEIFRDSMKESLDTLGQLVSDSILKYISKSTFNYSSINIIGFSLGGVIARCALKYLENYLPKMNMFITFSSPHLGIS